MPTAAPASGVWKFWRRTARPAGRPFAVRCACGGEAVGRRQPDPQTAPCPRCGAPLFVLGESAWPLVEAPPETSAPTADSQRNSRRILGVNAALAALLLFFLAAHLWVWRLNQRRPEQENFTAVQAWRAAVALAEMQLWSRAAEEAETAAGARDTEVRAGAIALRAELEPLLALSSGSLANLVREAGQTPFSGWPGVWRRKHQGRAVAWALEGDADFDLMANADPGFSIDWGFSAAERVELEKGPAPRCFTLLLDSCKLEEDPTLGSRWIVRFRPGSLRRLSPTRFPLHHRRGVVWLLAQAERRGPAMGPPFHERLRREAADVERQVPLFAWRQVWASGGEENWLFGPPAEPTLLSFELGAGPADEIRFSGVVRLRKPAGQQKK